MGTLLYFMFSGTIFLLHARQWRAGILTAILLGMQIARLSPGKQAEETVRPQPVMAAASAEQIEDAPAPPEEEPSLEDTLRSVQQQWAENEAAGKPNPLRLHVTANRIRKALCETGTLEHCNVPQAKNVDLDRLAYAVAVAETGNCSKGTGVSKNNCHGIMECRRSGCSAKTFANTTQSFVAFQKLWLEAYGDRFPTLSDAKRYSAGPGDTWLHRVRSAYAQSASTY